MKTGKLVTLLLVVFSVACGPEVTPLPTLMPTAVLPTSTPAPTATYEPHRNVNELVARVAGTMLRSFEIDIYTDEVSGRPYPDGRVSYDIDIVVNSPATLTRNELLQLAHDLSYEVYYNFAGDQPISVTLHLRAGATDSGISGCVLGLGIGYRSLSRHLPQGQPANLEGWFNDLVREQYYGDLPGQTDALLAYGNDPASAPGCSRDNWQN